METAIILAGGDSKRIGYPKSLLKLGEKTLIEVLVENIKEHFRELVLVTDRPDYYSHLPVRLTGDVYTNLGKSSLRGIHAGLNATSSEYNFVIACDMPFARMQLVEYMYSCREGYDAVVPRVGSYYQPLFSLYRRSCKDAVERCLEAHKYKVTEFYTYVRVRHLTVEEINKYDPSQLSFFNVNTPEDYKKAKMLVAQGTNVVTGKENDNNK